MTGMISLGPNYSALSALGGANGDTECKSLDQSPYLGVEEMMVLLQTRLGKLDGEVKDMMAQQEHRMAQRDAVKAFSNAMGGTKDMTPEKWGSVRQELEAAIKKLPAGDPAREQMEDKLAELDAKMNLSDEDKAKIADYEAKANDPFSGGLQRMAAAAGMQTLIASKSGGIGETQWKAEKADMDQVYENIGDQAEIEMLKLQSHMTKRTTLVQLTTNIVQKLEAAPDMIAKNI